MEDGSNSDTSPVPVSTPVDDRSGQPDETLANKIPKPNTKKTTIEQILEWLQEFRKFWWMVKFQYTEALTPVLLMKLL